MTDQKEKDFLKLTYNFMYCLAETMKDTQIDKEDVLDSKKTMTKILFSTLTSHFAIEGRINFRYTREEKEKTCLICNKDFIINEVCRTQTCEHLFHAKCICKHIKESKQEKCPLCNKEITDFLLPLEKDASYL